MWKTVKQKLIMNVISQFLENIYKLDWGKHWLPFPICQIDIYGRYVSKFSFIFLDELPRDAKIEFYYYRDQIHEKKITEFCIHAYCIAMENQPRNIFSI